MDYEKIIEVVERVENEYDELENKNEISKKDIAIELAIELVDIPVLPNIIEDRKAVKALKRFILGHIIDAIVAAFNKVGKFLHKNASQMD